MATMPERVRCIYDPLWREVSYLHLNWTCYRQVFGTSPERIDLLNQLAPAIFWALRGLMLDDVFLGISRLTDRPRTSGQDNLVLERLVDAVEEDEPGLPAKLGLDSLMGKVRSACEVFREIGHKRPCHDDLQVAAQREPQSPAVTSASHLNVEDALAAIRDLLNAVQAHYLGGETR